MLNNKRTYGYSTKKKHVFGRGFVDSISSIFNQIKSSALPALSNVGSYLKTNKDLILKPLIGAAGQLGAKALTEGIPAIINRIQRDRRDNLLRDTSLKNTNINHTNFNQAILEDPKFKELLQSITSADQPGTSIPNMSVSNILGSGVKKNKKGSGIKKF